MQQHTSLSEHKRLSRALPFPSPSMLAPPSSDTVHLEQLFAVARRQWKVVVAAMFAAIVLGVIYAMAAIPLYSASTSVLIDRPEGNLVGQLSTIGGKIEDDSSVISEVELLSSKAIGYAVVDQLKLGENPEFLGQRTSVLSVWIDDIRTFISGFVGMAETDAAPTTPDQRRHSALQILMRNTSVSRIGRSYVLSLDYVAPSPQMAMRIATTFADVYMLDKLNSKFESTRRASNWLQDRIAELGKMATDSDLAVQMFREQNNLVTADGKLVSDQQLSELNSALIVARSDTAQARARVERVRSIVASGSTEAVVPDVLVSAVSNELRTKYLQAAKMASDVSGRFGPNHAQAVRLRAEMAEYQRLMFSELNRIAESYQSELEVAEARERELTQNVQRAELTATDAGKTQVQLRELQRSAETYRKLHETFLQRYHEAVQEQSFPVTEARIIAPAELPLAPSAPKKSLVVALFAFLGIVFGIAVATVREVRDRFFRTGDQVRDEVGLEYLGSLPVTPTRRIWRRGSAKSGQREIGRVNTITHYAVENPLSMFSETMRSAKIAIDVASKGERCKVAGFVSALPGEGKSTAAINFAQQLASNGARTLLIDADLRNPGSSRLLAPQAEHGLAEFLQNDRIFEEIIWTDTSTGLKFIPSRLQRNPTQSANLLASSAMEALLDRVQGQYDYIILDLPPLGPVVDARAIAHLIGNFVWVVEWGKTSRRMVKETVSNEVEIAARTRGVILNKVDTQKLKLYRAYGSAEYYYRTYGSYYQS
ncbi:succinoglycan biosynthesis transport protein ExoP [Rhizobium sp. NFR07]|uniref:polysaccharide biosynthesis tyrosine autokinase n=1 Tax=Rhizobium sp. NFR07 TaxID=1566262 RepID=UPI0008F27469|nr:polysaccharide biosynthesis tyrosine autokinase [Rhizobium sp. NFR07]SFB62961.1 succinoglycan biosynthesis transport protein ExoP [Rhizobium sp. NFR07]